MRKAIKMLFVMFVFLFLFPSGNKAFASVTWNPNDKGKEVILTNNNLTAQIPNVSNGVRATEGKSSGKWYWEITIDSPGSYGFGVINGTDPLYSSTSEGVPYEAKHSVVCLSDFPFLRGGDYQWDNYDSAYDTFKEGDVLGFKLDCDNEQLQVTKNGKDLERHSNICSVSNCGYPIYPLLTSNAVNNKGTVTANFGQTSFKYRPYGYTPYDSNYSITLNNKKLNLYVGQTYNLVAATSPAGANVTWESNNQQVAQVTELGQIIALQVGTCNITATIDTVDVDTQCSVNVTAEPDPEAGQTTSGAAVLNIEPEKNEINLNDKVSANLIIDNIKDIAAEDVKIKYDNTKLKFLGMDEVDGIKLVESEDNDGELRVITASKGADNVVEAKKVLLKLNFQGIASGDAVVDVTKGRVSDGISMEKDLTDDQCSQATIKVNDTDAAVEDGDVNKSGDSTLLDLAIDARHFGEDPSTLTEYNADQVVNGKIDDDDLLKIAEYMLANANYSPNK